MVAIIKKNFRLQNARDFLESLKSHPRVSSGAAAPLEESTLLQVAPTAGSTVNATATYQWTWPISNTVTDKQSNSIQLKTDAVYGLREKIGTHLYDRNHYVFIGKSTKWVPQDWPGNTDLFNSFLDPAPELAPKPALDTAEEERRVWDEILGLKKITDLSASLVIPRSDWDGTGKTVYRIYDDRDPNLYNTPTQSDRQRIIGGRPNAEQYRVGNFYVINSEYDLFICIETGLNSLGLPNASTEEPRRTQHPEQLIDFSSQDGYVWKYITSIKQADVVKFTTDHWIPVRTLIPQEIKASQLDLISGGLEDPQAVVQAQAQPGSVLSFVVENPGEQNDSYTTTHTGVLTSPTNSSTPGVPSTATLNLSETLSPPPPLSTSNNAYANMHIYITSQGRGLGEVYTIASYNPSAGGSPQITLATGEQWSTAITNPADPTIKITYDILPKLTVTSNGTQPVKLKPVVSNGRISRVKVIDPGLNASSVIVTVDPTSGLTQSTPPKVPAKVRAVLSPRLGLGADPEKDLGAFYVLLNAKFSHDDPSGDFPLSNDYRQIGIIRDVRKKSDDPNEDGKLATADTLNACDGLSVDTVVGKPTGLTPFQSDEIIKQTYVNSSGTTVTARARLIEFKGDDANLDPLTNEPLAYIISYIQTPETGYEKFIVSRDSSEYIETERKDSQNNVLGPDFQSTCNVRSLIPAEAKKYHGEILYLENRRAILRAKEQTEDIKAIIEF